MRNAIIGLVQQPTKNPGCHQTGWVWKWKELLEAEVLYQYDAETLAAYDVAYVYNDINGGVSNFNARIDPGTKQGDAANARYQALHLAHMSGLKVKQLDKHQLWYDFIIKKKHDTIPESFKWMNSGILPVSQADIQPDYTVIGDSHALSITPEYWSCDRNDAKTLRGALKSGLSSFLTGKEIGVAFTFGNIDLRHQFGRPTWTTIEDAVADYKRQVDGISESGVEVWVAQAMLQCPDTRVPNTGWGGVVDHKKVHAKHGRKEIIKSMSPDERVVKLAQLTADGYETPYYGLHDERRERTARFNRLILEAFGDRTIMYDDAVYMDANGCLDETKMEDGSSFHLRPDCYNNRWFNG